MWVSPAELIPLAEESGLIVPLGQAILASTLRTVRSMKDKGLRPGKISVNVAAAQLRDPAFAASFLKAVADHGHEGREFAIEITESVILDRQSGPIRAMLDEFAEAGVRIGLDDFGTGYASLAHLQRFPVSFLKIDRSFVCDPAPSNAAIARTVVSLAHSLDMRVVAEGVETEAQFDLLAGMGCDYAQGYLVARPMFADEAAAYLARASRQHMPPPAKVA
jgi:EAL domain-containing protein (putative c-di-GMP-specific phosphodiesterase class I)